MQYEFNPSKRRNERPDWLPDWRNEMSYTISPLISDGEPLPMAQWDLLIWAWQFIRRNPEYWADWRRFNELPDVEFDEKGVSYKSPKWRTSSYGDWTPMQYFHATKPVLWGETVGEYEERTGEQPELLPVFLERKWGLSGITDPARGLPLWLDVHHEVSDRIPPHWSGGQTLSEYLGYDFMRQLPAGAQDAIMAHQGTIYHFDAHEEAEVAVVAFDLRFPIGPQIEQARRMLQKLYEQARDPQHCLATASQEISQMPIRTEKFPMILRAYDGLWSGATAQEVADVLYPHQKRGAKPTEAGVRLVETDVAKGKKLMQTGYKVLLDRSLWG